MFLNYYFFNNLSTGSRVKHRTFKSVLIYNYSLGTASNLKTKTSELVLFIVKRREKQQQNETKKQGGGGGGGGGGRRREEEAHIYTANIYKNKNKTLKKIV